MSLLIPEFDVGDVPRSFGEFRDAAGALADPQTVKVSVRPPSGVISTYVFGTDAAVVKDSTGKYHIDIDANASGAWAVRWFSEGTGKAAVEMRFKVKKSDFV